MKKAWSTFEVEFIKGEVDRQCEELVGWVGGRVVGVGKAWSTFVVLLIQGEVDHQ